MNQETNPTCASCKETISASGCVKAGENNYHVEHFICKICSTSLVNQSYFPSDDESDPSIYCSSCYIQNVASKCEVCGLGILDDMIQIQSGSLLHKECFKCTQCNKQLISNYTKDKNNKLSCMECVEVVADKCTACNLPILDVSITAIGKKYHEKCLVCSVCTNQIGSQSFTSHLGQPTHTTCVKRVCGYCEKDIHEVECFQKEGYYYHVECLKQFKQKVADEQKEEEKKKEELAKQKKIEEALKSAPKPIIKAEVIQPQKQVAPAFLDRIGQNKQEGADGNKSKDDSELKSVKEMINAISLNKQKTENGIQEAQKQQAAKAAAALAAAQTVQDEGKTYTYEQLISNQLPDVNPAKREQHLSEAEFLKVFGVSKTDFNQLKGWKQQELKKKFKLF